jgi:hypothetical protein
MGPPLLGTDFPRWVFAGSATRESVKTRVLFHSNPEAVWGRILFYEEVPGRAPFPLRALLPSPVSTQGDKTRVGETIRCNYAEGYLLKRMTRIESRRFLGFEVIEQQLGIENYVRTLSGSYTLCALGGETGVVLTTNYLAFLQPRWLWRPAEALLVRQLHRHILRGICGATLSPHAAEAREIAEMVTP